MTWSTVLGVLFAAVCVSGIHDAGVLNVYKHWTSGDGTYYGNTQAGLCSLNIPDLPYAGKHVDKLVALNRPQMMGSSSCGMCLRVNGSGNGLGNDPITGSFTAYVKDLCPECLAGSVDLALNGDGRWKVSIQAIQCPVGSSKIEYRLEGSNDWYLKLQVRNERIPATTVEMYQPKHGAWVKLSRTADGFWNFPAEPQRNFGQTILLYRMPATTVEMYQPKHGAWVKLSRTADGFWNFPADSRVDKPIQRPFRLRLHAPNGHTLIDTVNPPSMSYQGVIKGSGVQFPLDPNLPH